jgi:hypothetical protein
VREEGRDDAREDAVERRVPDAELAGGARRM